MHVVKDNKDQTPATNGHYENIPPHLRDFLKDTDKVKSFSPELSKVDEEMLLLFAVECVHVNNKHYNHLFKNCCNICDKELTPFELTLIKPQDHIVVCKEHRKSANVYQVDLERARLKISPRNYV